MREMLEESGIDLSNASKPQSNRNRFSNSSGRIKKVRKHLMYIPQMYNPSSKLDNSSSIHSHTSETPRSLGLSLSSILAISQSSDDVL